MNILTFDIEDWFHINFEKEFNDETLWENYESRIEQNTDVILEILEEKNIKATFFCLGWVARKYPTLIRKISDKGHDIGCHSDIHNLVSVMTPDEFRNDLKRSKQAIEDVIGMNVNMYRAPAFSIGKNNLWAFETLIENGIEIDCSVFPAKHHFGGFSEINTHTPFILDYNGSNLKEFPMSTYRFLGKDIVVTGGGYFRFFPYKMIQYYMSQSNYNMTYFHPRDIDSNQPLLENLSSIRKFKSYYGLKKSLSKLKKLTNDFNFVSVSQANKEYRWKTSKIINISCI